MKSIDEHLEHIRSQPEHIRLRWVWGIVVGLMIIILFIWTLSMRINLSSEGRDNGTRLREVPSLINETLEQNPDTPTIDDLIKEGQEVIDSSKQAGQAVEELNKAIKEQQNEEIRKENTKAIDKLPQQPGLIAVEEEPTSEVNSLFGAPTDGGRTLESILEETIEAEVAKPL